MSVKKRVGFKYRSGPAALRSLSDASAYFASPGELNDSLEAKFIMPERTTYAEKLSEVHRFLSCDQSTGFHFEVSTPSRRETSSKVARLKLLMSVTARGESRGVKS